MSNKKIYPWVVVGLLWGVALADDQPFAVYPVGYHSRYRAHESVYPQEHGHQAAVNQIYFLRALMGVSEALYIPAGLSLITDYHQGKTRSLAVGIHMTGLYTGQALGGFGATVANAFTWETTFHWFGIVGIAYSVILILFLKDKKDHIVHKIKEAGAAVENPVKGALKGMGMLFTNISFWIILLYFATPSLPGWATKNWLPTLFSENLSIDMVR